MYKTSEKDIMKKFTTDVFNKIVTKGLRNIKGIYLHNDIRPDNLNDEAKNANSGKYDFVLNFHSNAFNGSGKAKGFEILKYKNEVSIPLISFMDNIRVFMKGIGVVDRGIKDSNNLRMIDNITPSSCFMEFGFMDNKEDMLRLKTNWDKIVNQVAYAINYYLRGKVLLVYSDQTTGGTNYL